MANTRKDISLRLVSPSFDSPLIASLMELDHLRKLKLGGTTAPFLFFQLKAIFHLFESVGSARIEGNRTTLSEYVEQKLEKTERSNERFSEIANVEQAMEFIESNIDEGSEITGTFIRELHQLTVGELTEEGDRTPGAFRTWDVTIKGSIHTPPTHLRVRDLMEELIRFINKQEESRYDLIKIALAHHRFAWIHPFGNGNGRVVRLLTYALLIKFGFQVKRGQLLNPTAVFCNDREKYYEMLSIADKGTDDAYLSWCEYVLSGICEEIHKVNKLLDHDYLVSKLLRPAITRSRERGLITKDEESVLKMGVREQNFKASDLKEVLPKLKPRQRTYLITKLKENQLIRPLKENGREYIVEFANSYLLRSLTEQMEAENFIPAIND